MTLVGKANSLILRAQRTGMASVSSEMSRCHIRAMHEEWRPSGQHHNRYSGSQDYSLLTCSNARGDTKLGNYPTCLLNRLNGFVPTSGAV